MTIRPPTRNIPISSLFQRIGRSSSKSVSSIQKNAYIFLSSLKEKIEDLLDWQELPLVEGVRTTRPRLAAPRISPDPSFGPSRFFTRGAIDQDKKKNPEPIPYLMEESQETSKPRPIPRNRKLLQSLRKGKGVLRKNSQGLIYLDVDNHFISSLIPFLKSQGLVRPPYFNLFGTPDGAHIPVITARESFFHGLQELAETGKEYSFEIDSLYSMEPASWPEVQEVWFLQVEANDLEAVRRRYFLSSQPGGHPFHIAIAVKARNKSTPKPLPPTFFKVNPAFLAA